MDIVLIAPDSLHAVWKDVRAGLEKMPVSDWIPEDVYHAVRSGESALYIGVGDAGFGGFMVLRKQQTEFSKQPVLHVWLAYSVAEPDVLAHGIDTVREVAKRIGAQKITFGSPRKGWAKRFPVVDATYEIPLEGAFL